MGFGGSGLETCGGFTEGPRFTGGSGLAIRGVLTVGAGPAFAVGTGLAAGLDPALGGPVGAGRAVGVGPAVRGGFAGVFGSGFPVDSCLTGGHIFGGGSERRGG